MNELPNRPLRCVHYLDAVSLSSGGVVRATLDLCGALARSGCRVMLLTFDDQDIPDAWRDDSQGVPTVVRIDRPRAGIWLTSKAKRSARAVLDQADVLHLHTPWDPNNLWFARAARRRRVPYVVTIHGMLDDWSMRQRRLKKRAYLTLAGRRMLEKAAVIHCTAEAEAQQAGKWVHRGRIAVLPYAFDFSPFEGLSDRSESQAHFDLPADEIPTVLFLSRLHPKKGLERLIDAVAIARQEGNPLRLVVAGTGEERYEQRLRRQVEDLKLRDSVLFMGLVVGERKTTLYRAADLFVLPTSQENFGLVLIEAMACGTPVVTTRGVDIWKEIQAAGASIVEPESVAILEAIRTILGQADRGAALGERGREWVRQRFDEAELVRAYRELYGWSPNWGEIAGKCSEPRRQIPSR